ncbi:dephospho-CoA kinase [bacterium]|nr:MAG: dephospho-CoA kinase [bacterium]
MPSDRDFFLVGVTGGIGSGKSAVCAGFERLGRTVLSADGLAREIMDRDPSVKKKVQQLIGQAAYTLEGVLDRKLVAARAFGDHSIRKRLDAIVHPAVFQEIDSRISQLPREQRLPYVIIEAALVYESGMDKKLDYVIVVQAEEETRIRRVMERDGCTREEVLRRIAAQMPADLKAKKADFVIRNEADKSPIASKVQFIDHLLSQMLNAGSPAGDKQK